MSEIVIEEDSVGKFLILEKHGGNDWTEAEIDGLSQVAETVNLGVGT